jgi:hypothetical protein
MSEITPGSIGPRRFRIVATRYKVLYFAIWLGVTVLVSTLVLPQLGEVARFLVVNVVWFTFFVVAVRSFRGAGEEIEPPRAWWRMTARPTAGFVLGIAWLLLELQNWGLILFGFLPWPESLGLALLNDLTNVLVAAAFLHSSIRLLRSARGPVSA